MPVLSLGLHTAAPPLVLPRLTALLKRQTPAVVQTYCLNTNITGSIAARLARVPVIITGELTRRDQAGSPLKRLRDRLLPPLVRLAYGIADSVIFVSDHVKTQWVGERDSPKYRTIYSPFNDRKLADLRPATPRPLHRDHRVSIGIVARLSPEKGHEDLLHALPRILAAYPRARLLIVGAGPSETFLRHLAGRLTLSEHIEFRGHRDDVADQMRRMDIFVHPSRSEGMGIAIVEAMVLGLPVVATDHGGIPEVVSSGRTGILVPPRDPARLAEAVLHLLDNPAEARLMGKRARQCALARFHPRVFTRLHEELYRELLRRKFPLGTLPDTARRSAP
jgi:glycosyltransferase involved in cell wall biosynthesis